MNGDKMCTECNCDVGTTEEICHKNNGTCICGPNFAGERCNECAPGFYNFPSCLRKYFVLFLFTYFSM
jgi:laminin alpha 3/5